MAERIVIDAGHNGLSDPGAVYNGRRESDDVLRLAMAVGDILERNGYMVDYTRTGNINQSVVQKAQLANQTGADLFVSLHRNKASYPGQYEGVQTLIYDMSGLKQTMAENINQNLEGVGFKNINVEARPDLAVLRRTQMPALLVEVGFIDNVRDNQLFDTRFDEIAQAIADGIMDTLNSAGIDPAPVSEEMSMPIRYASREPDWMDQETMMTPNRPDSTQSNMPGSMQNNMPDSIQSNMPSSMQNNMPSSMQNNMQGSVPAPGMSSPRPLYRVQVGAFYNLQNAIELEQELKRLGYNTWIVTV